MSKSSFVLSCDPGQEMITWLVRRLFALAETLLAPMLTGTVCSLLSVPFLLSTLELLKFPPAALCGAALWLPGFEHFLFFARSLS